MALNDRSKIVDKNIEEEMKTSYIDYSMSVIVSRALPDVRDGLKPSQRRILVAMNDLNLAPGRPYRKCAKIAGDTSGNYHPHGEQVVYPTLVRLAQDWVMRYPLVDGQGNFGSIDGDAPAAMRYTEARLTPLAMEMLADLEKNTVDFRSNYDETREEPAVLPGVLPNLLVNGCSGIAVGMATEHSAAQPHRDLRRDHPGDRQSRTRGRRPDAHRQGPRLPDRRHHQRHAGHSRLLPHGARPDPHARARDRRRRTPRAHEPRGHADSVPGQQVDAARAHRRHGARRQARPASATCATNPIATACAS